MKCISHPDFTKPLCECMLFEETQEVLLMVEADVDGKELMRKGEMRREIITGSERLSKLWGA